MGCGAGLLVRRPAAVSRGVVGIDADPPWVVRAANCLRSAENVSVRLARFEDFEADACSYDLVTFVASLHHLRRRETLFEARNAQARQGNWPSSGRRSPGKSARDPPTVVKALSPFPVRAGAPATRAGWRRCRTS
ncbi:class I SAM-dependent methyltransferase [Mycobacterium paraseoulense]|uniref:class I SAM-dependent methyltransferase n=1 Tax=Mycobacterium paraseoulense TaxID=590652 RepID=UPI0027BA4E43|nr:class I SAM-dependent methyltransferase [Mycobacterium paraseoulense]